MDERAISVLLVEDDEDDVLLIRDTLGGQRAARFEWTVTGRLSDALAKLSGHRFDVALLDLSLPDSRGLETFLKLHGAAPEVPVVLLTGLQDEQLGLEAVQRGAQDYLIKGAHDGNVLMRSIRYAIERARRQRAERTLCAKDAEMTAAREIQQRLFPAAAPACAGFEIAGASVPAVETGGDYFDYVPLRDGSIAVIVADVASHGLGPALVMAETRAYLRALLLDRTDVAEVLTLANRALSHDTADEWFVTLFLARLDPKSRTMVYASAGHPPGYILAGSGQVRRDLSSTGLPLGVEPDSTFTATAPIPLQPGEVVLLLTDGIAEARAGPDSHFGADRALEIVRSHQHRPAAEIVATLHDQVRQFASGAQSDDLTTVVIKVEERC